MQLMRVAWGSGQNQYKLRMNVDFDAMNEAKSSVFLSYFKNILFPLMDNICFY